MHKVNIRSELILVVLSCQKHETEELSCLCQLKSQMPFDFDLVSHTNERSCAQRHLQVLEKGDVVVYDS